LKVLFFARARELVGTGELEWEAPQDCTVSVLVQSLMNKYPALRDLRSQMLLAVNKSYTGLDAETPLRESDEIAFIPPLSGG